MRKLHPEGPVVSVRHNPGRGVRRGYSRVQRRCAYPGKTGHADAGRAAIPVRGEKA